MVYRWWKEKHHPTPEFEKNKEVIRTYNQADNRVTDVASGEKFAYTEIVSKGNIRLPLEARLQAMMEERLK